MPQPILASFLLVLSFHAGYIATYTPQDAPYQTQSEQSGYNSCGMGYNQTSECQNVYVNSVQDFCLWAPPYPGSTVGDTEVRQGTVASSRITEKTWKPCSEWKSRGACSGYGTRLIPDGTITGAHLVVTPDYIQITGVGNLTNLNILATDLGGELDYYGAAGAGYPVGGLVFSNAFGQLAQIPEWTSFISYNLFCIRACNPSSSANLCQYAYPTMGCEWNMPASYSGGVFEHCVGDSAEPVGIYGTSTFSPGQPMTPSPQSIPPSSSCTFYSTISNGQSLRPSDVTSTGTLVTFSATISADSKISSSHTSQTSTSLSSFTQSSSSFAPTSSSQPASSGPSSSTSSTPFQCPPGYLMAKPSTNGSASFKVSFGGWRPLVLIALTILLGLWC